MFQINAEEYNEAMKVLFKETYTVIASKILKRTGITSGNCIDLGGGPGMLGIELAKTSQLYVNIYDKMYGFEKFVVENSKKNGVSNQVKPVNGAADKIGFDNNSIDLVVSQGAIFFWENQEKVLSEVYRVLKPGGWGFIGHGFGSRRIKAGIDMRKTGKWLQHNKDKRFSCRNTANLLQGLIDTMDFDGDVERDETGTWLVFQKKA